VWISHTDQLHFVLLLAAEPIGNKRMLNIAWIKVKKEAHAGTNVMLRARAAYSVARHVASGATPLQIYSEDEVSEDLELGVRIHAAGYKSVLVSEKLCTGEVS
jgi:cellulose synthase/poly-beta-1,6-N-acetylglucosamine synthase-like glycosyltransferase